MAFEVDPDGLRAAADVEGHYWRWATSGAAGLFVCQVLFLVCVSLFFSSDATAVSPVAFVITAGVSSVLAVGLRWVRVGVARGVAVAAAATAVMWVLSAVLAVVVAAGVEGR